MPVIQSHAKINVGLKITGERPDGYHTLQTIFQEISLADRLTLEPRDEGWEFICHDPSGPQDESNLCIRAYLALKNQSPAAGGVKIRLEKNIPIGAGLGGGSSNAAAVLKGVNELYSLNLSAQQLEGISVSLGADIPFFIRGGTQYAEGIGEILSPAKLPSIGAILLVVPSIHISTPWAYRQLKNHLPGDYTAGKFAAACGSFDSWEFLENDFESLVFQTYPEIGKIKDQLLESGAVFASLSGSGSTVFGIYGDKHQARSAQQCFLSPLRTFITHPIET